MNWQTVVGWVFLEEGDFIEEGKEVHRSYYTLKSEQEDFYPLKFETGEQARKVLINKLIFV